MMSVPNSICHGIVLYSDVADTKQESYLQATMGSTHVELLSPKPHPFEHLSKLFGSFCIPQTEDEKEDDNHEVASRGIVLTPSEPSFIEIIETESCIEETTVIIDTPAILSTELDLQPLILEDLESVDDSYLFSDTTEKNEHSYQEMKDSKSPGRKAIMDAVVVIGIITVAILVVFGYAGGDHTDVVRSLNHTDMTVASIGEFKITGAITSISLPGIEEIQKGENVDLIVNSESEDTVLKPHGEIAPHLPSKSQDVFKLEDIDDLQQDDKLHLDIESRVIHTKEREIENEEL
jgi:hypothetical protein